MTEKRKMSLVPPAAKNDERLKSFIEEPERKTKPKEPDEPRQEPEPVVVATPVTEPKVSKKPVKKNQFPWEAEGVTSEIIKPFLLRLTQPEKLKAEYIVQNSLEYKSLQDFCLKAFLKQVDKELKKLASA